MTQRIITFDPMFEELSELPLFNIEDFTRYVSVNEKFYISAYDDWLLLGIDFPIKNNHLQLKLSDESAVINAEQIPCFSDDYITDVQITIYDFNLDLDAAKKLEYANNSIVQNFHVSNHGFNKVSSNTLNVINSIRRDSVITKNCSSMLIAITNISDETLFLTKDSISGLYLGDPCFTVADSLKLDSKFLSNIRADDIQQVFFDSSSNIQFVIENIDLKIHDSEFINLTGTPNRYTKGSNYLRSNGINWTTWNTVSADEIYAPLTKCRITCECDDSSSFTTSLQQSICQLYQYKSNCIEYLKFEYLINSDSDLDKMKSLTTPRIIYDVRSDEVWVWNCGEWMIDVCKSVCSLEKNKIYFNITTRKLFYLACDCSAYCLMDLPFTEDPCAV